MSGDEFFDGYLDGRNPDCPEPSANRSHSYRHSFAVGRAEIEGRILGSYHAVLAAADAAEQRDISA